MYSKQTIIRFVIVVTINCFTFRNRRSLYKKKQTILISDKVKPLINNTMFINTSRPNQIHGNIGYLSSIRGVPDGTQQVVESWQF